MRLFNFKKEKKDVIKEIYKKDRLKRYASFLIGILIVALAFNIFILPNDIVYGVSGLGVIFKRTMNIDPSLVILIGLTCTGILTISSPNFNLIDCNLFGTENCLSLFGRENCLNL